jgi:hypothetical protein
MRGVRGVSTLYYKRAEIGVRDWGFRTAGKSGAAAAAGVGTGSGRCGNGQRAVVAAEVGVPLTVTPVPKGPDSHLPQFCFCQKWPRTLCLSLTILVLTPFSQSPPIMMLPWLPKILYHLTTDHTPLSHYLGHPIIFKHNHPGASLDYWLLTIHPASNTVAVLLHSATGSHWTTWFSPRNSLASATNKLWICRFHLHCFSPLFPPFLSLIPTPPLFVPPWPITPLYWCFCTSLLE